MDSNDRDRIDAGMLSPDLVSYGKIFLLLNRKKMEDERHRVGVSP